MKTEAAYFGCDTRVLRRMDRRLDEGPSPANLGHSEFEMPSLAQQNVGFFAAPRKNHHFSTQQQ
jgi:hypothetical protein